MGYKINPISFRLGTRRNWNSIWFGNIEYQYLLNDDLQIVDYVNSMFHKHKIPKSNCYIKRWLNNRMNVSLAVYNPPNEYKKQLSTKQLELSMSKISGSSNSKFSIMPTAYKGSSFFFTFPITNAQLVANYVAYELEKRNPFKEVVQDIMDWVYESKNLSGIHISCSGRFNGEDRSKTLLKKHGKIPYSTLDADIDYANATANTIYGSVGIKVWLHIKYKKRRKKYLIK